MAATHIFVELSRAIGCYNVYISLTGVPEQLHVRLTPTPECLYVQVTEALVLVLPLAAPVPDTSQVAMQLKDSVLAIRLPCAVDAAPGGVVVPQLPLPLHSLSCLHCGSEIASGLTQAYELPELEWEELSELWNCHPSHHQKNPLVLEADRCFVAKLAVVLHPTNVVGVQASGDVPETTVVAYTEAHCRNCSDPLGEAKFVNGHIRQYWVQLNRVQGAEGNWTLLGLVVRQLALLPDFDYKRTLALTAAGAEKAVLMSVSAKSALILRNGKYQEALKCLYEFSDPKDFRLCRVPLADFQAVCAALKTRNRCLPRLLRKVGPKRLAYFVYAEVFP